MKVKITKCSNKHYWYANMIGEKCEVQKMDSGHYCLTDSELYPLEITDCEIIHEPEPNDKLFQAAVAAMQGIIDNEHTVEFAEFYKITQKEATSIIAWDYAEALINEGKKRGHL